MRAHDANFVLGDLDSLRERTQMVAPKSAVLSTNPAAGDGGEFCQLPRREALARGLDGDPCTLGIHARLIARRLQFLDPLFQRWIVKVRDAAFNGVVKALQPLFGFRRPFGEFVRLGSAASIPFLATVEMRGKGDKDADRIAGFKKPEMVEAAEELLAGTGWLPEPLRTPKPTDDDADSDFELVDHEDIDGIEDEAQSAVNGGETAIGKTEPSVEDDLAAASTALAAAE